VVDGESAGSLTQIRGYQAPNMSLSAIPEATKARLRAEHGRLNPFALKKIIETKLRNFFTVLSHLDREPTKT
jgi:hypothetical protein